MNEILEELDNHDRVTTTVYRPLPELAPQGETEPIAFFGFRALTFLIETECYATLDDRALELAHMASQGAIAGPLEDSARERIVRIRRMILMVLADRAAYRRANDRELVVPETNTEPTTLEQLEQQSPADQAVRYLKTALMLIMDPQLGDPGDPTSKVPRKPKPRGPAPGDALEVPRSRQSDTIAF
jgi:hypothetical protein